MSHALAGFVAEPGSDQFVVTPHGAVEEDQRRTRKPSLQIVGDPGTGSEKVEILPSGFVGDAKPQRVSRALASAVLRTAGMRLAFQIPRGLARHGERLDLDAARRAVGQRRLECPVQLYRLTPHTLFAQHVEDAV